MEGSIYWPFTVVFVFFEIFFNYCILLGCGRGPCQGAWWKSSHLQKGEHSDLQVTQIKLFQILEQSSPDSGTGSSPPSAAVACPAPSPTLPGRAWRGCPLTGRCPMSAATRRPWRRVSGGWCQETFYDDSHYRLHVRAESLQHLLWWLCWQDPTLRPNPVLRHPLDHVRQVWYHVTSCHLSWAPCDCSLVFAFVVSASVSSAERRRKEARRGDREREGDTTYNSRYSEGAEEDFSHHHAAYPATPM